MTTTPIAAPSSLEPTDLDGAERTLDNGLVANDAPRANRSAPAEFQA